MNFRKVKRKQSNKELEARYIIGCITTMTLNVVTLGAALIIFRGYGQGSVV